MNSKTMNKAAAYLERLFPADTGFVLLVECADSPAQLISNFQDGQGIPEFLLDAVEVIRKEQNAENN